jgi:hypothetical protein
MAKVKGLGGSFFKAEDPKALTVWYRAHFDSPTDDEGVVVFWWGDEARSSTVWAPLLSDTTAFHWPDDKQWVINYRGDDLDGMLDQLREERVNTSDDAF